MLLTIHLKASYNALHPLKGSWGLIAASIQNGWRLCICIELLQICCLALPLSSADAPEIIAEFFPHFQLISLDLYLHYSVRSYIIKITPLLKELLSEITNIKWHVHCTLYTSNGLRRKMLTLR